MVDIYQVNKCADFVFKDNKGKNDIEVSTVLNSYFFSNRDIPEKEMANVSDIVGQADNGFAPLLLMQVHCPLLCNMSFDDLVSMHDLFLAKAGKHGYDVIWSGGSNGLPEYSNTLMKAIRGDSVFPQKTKHVVLTKRV